MKSFKDNLGREWSARVDSNALMRVRDMLGVNLGEIEQIEKNWRRLRTDDLFVVELAYAVCKPEAESRKLTMQEFCGALGGDSIRSAYEAIAEGISDFFRDPEIRRTLKQLVEAMETGLREAMSEAAAAISGATPSSSQAAPASTPDPSP